MPERPLLSVNGVTLQYRTGEQLVTATYRVSFEVRKGPKGLQADAVERI